MTSRIAAACLLGFGVLFILFAIVLAVDGQDDPWIVCLVGLSTLYVGWMGGMIAQIVENTRKP